MAVSGYYYVDKTLLIKDLLDYHPLVSLFTRPRRFGKTLNMDMLRVFFEKTSEDTSIYFKGTNIWAAGEKYRKEQGRYPVIFLTFKDVKYNTWEETRINLYSVIQSEYRRHIDLLESDKLTSIDKQYMEKMLWGTLDTALWAGTLANLSLFLDLHYGIAPVILIDEYDTPIQQGYRKGFYEDVIAFMRNLLSGGLKDNKHVSMAFMTGILRVAKESIFSGLNNLNVNSVLNNRYSEYFGFTEKEILAKMEPVVSVSTAIVLQQALLTGNMQMFQEELQRFIMSAFSYHDSSAGSFISNALKGMTNQIPPALV